MNAPGTIPFLGRCSFQEAKDSIERFFIVSSVLIGTTKSAHIRLTIHLRSFRANPTDRTRLRSTSSIFCAAADRALATRIPAQEEFPYNGRGDMHIPDGYLSPSTCAALYVCSASGWYAALKRIKGRLHTRTIPLVSVFAAFAFVVMMFNVPLPGGTTGHAVGVTVAAIVLGPWGSILAISIALAIQALFFGDGGITTLGANCFNMAVVGSFVAYAVYQAVATRSARTSRRRIFAAGIAGYAAINASALLAAIEFGIQPTFFHDAHGAPLYAPYPLHVAIPAMMLGHLTFAGLAEAAISAGMISYLQKADIGLLGGIKDFPDVRQALSAPAAVSSQGRLWGVVAALMLLTPLGILAAGTAWGEWSAADYAKSERRAQIEASSDRNAAPPAPPAGMKQLSTVWTAPFPNYAPRFIRSAAFGYVMSAMFGVGILLLASLLFKSLLVHSPSGKGPSRVST